MTAEIDPTHPAGRRAAAIRDLVPTGVVVVQPDRDVSWERREDLRPDTREAFAVLAGRVYGLPAFGDESIAIEGVCRVVIGGDRGGRGGERVTAVVVHVIDTAQPIRTVILPLE